ncbi:MAG: hypothetical protein FWE23_03090 [Chitinivibrionia bacterium]|nr:hypothetical protein [Chitinivibrionia bacterium]
MKAMIALLLVFFLQIFAENNRSNVCHGSDGRLFFIERGDTIFLTALKGTRGADGSVEESWFTTQHGARVKIADGIIVELIGSAIPEAVFGQYGIKSFERLANNIFLVNPYDRSRQFELSRELSQDTAVKYAHPNLIRERRAR